MFVDVHQLRFQVHSGHNQGTDPGSEIAQAQEREKPSQLKLEKHIGGEWAAFSATGLCGHPLPEICEDAKNVATKLESVPITICAWSCVRPQGLGSVDHVVSDNSPDTTFRANKHPTLCATALSHEQAPTNLPRL